MPFHHHKQSQDQCQRLTQWIYIYIYKNLHFHFSSLISFHLATQSLLSARKVFPNAHIKYVYFKLFIQGNKLNY